jgi:hypothetical protein
MCDALGYKNGRSVPDLNQCNVSEAKKQAGNQYCCCSGPPENLPECQIAGSKMGVTAGIWPVATLEHCYTSTVAYCTSRGKEASIWALIELSQCCLVICADPT